MICEVLWKYGSGRFVHHQFWWCTTNYIVIPVLIFNTLVTLQLCNIFGESKSCRARPKTHLHVSFLGWNDRSKLHRLLFTHLWPVFSEHTWEFFTHFGRAKNRTSRKHTSCVETTHDLFFSELTQRGEGENYSHAVSTANLYLHDFPALTSVKNYTEYNKHSIRHLQITDW